MLHVFTFYKFEKLLIIHFTGIAHDNFMVSIKSNPNVKKLQKKIVDNLIAHVMMYKLCL